MDTNILMPEQPNFHPLNSAEEKLKEQRFEEQQWQEKPKQKTRHNLPPKTQVADASCFLLVHL